MCVCVVGCACMYVCLHVYRHICGGAWVCIYVWPAVDPGCLPLGFARWVRVSCCTQGSPFLASLGGQLALGLPCLCPRWWDYSWIAIPARLFTGYLGSSSSPARQLGLYPLSHLSPVSSFKSVLNGLLHRFDDLKNVFFFEWTPAQLKNVFE